MAEVSGAAAEGGRTEGAPTEGGVLPVRFTGLLHATIVGLVAYIPLEEFLLKWLPVSDQVYSLARLGSEAVVYGLLIVVVVGRLVQGKSLRRTPIDGPLLVFVAIAATSIVVNHASLLPALITIRTLLRYVALYYAVVNLPLDEHRVRVLLLVILGAAVLQSGIALVQFAHGGPSSFWYPRATDLEVGGMQRNFSILTSGVEVGAVIGTFGHTVSLALFLLVAVSVVTALMFTQGDHVEFVAPQGVLFGLLGLFVLGILFTYSRASFLAALLGLGVVAWWRRHRREILRPVLLLASAALLLAVTLSLTSSVGDVQLKKVHVNPIENIRMAFGQATIEGRFSNTRLWLISQVGGSLVRSMTPLGFSPDQETARRRIAERGQGALDRILTYGPFEDVYWVAMLSYYGLLGLGAFWWLLWRLYRAAREVMRHTPGLWTRTAATALAALLVLLVPLTFLVRTFEFRSLSLCLWLLAGVTVNRLASVRSWERALADATAGEAETGPGGAGDGTP